jgi:T5orf172 domain
MPDFLTTEHFEYLRQIEVPSSAVMDARHMKRAAYQAELKRQGKGLAYVAEPCGKGHSLRLRLGSGHCAECSPIGISLWKRHHKPGVVYIAFSRSLRAYKVGSAKASFDRADGLNRDGYAGVSDWVLFYRREFSEAGLVETRAHTALAAWKMGKTYTRQGHGTSVKPREIFECTYDDARAAVEQSAGFALSEAYEFKR